MDYTYCCLHLTATNHTESILPLQHAPAFLKYFLLIITTDTLHACTGLSKVLVPHYFNNVVGDL